MMSIKVKDNYKGKKIKQVKGVTEIFDSFFEKELFDNIIEIGSGTGTFSIYFASKAKDMKASFITCDIKKINRANIKELESLDAIIITDDANQNNKIREHVLSSGRNLILNDGDKFRSFITYGPMLKIKDYMFIHDYYYKEKFIFDGLASWDDLENNMKKFNLNISKYTKVFRNYLWLCVTKSGDK